MHPILGRFVSPAFLPVYFFALVILAGTGVLLQPISLNTDAISLVDAMFTAVSATCVTGLAVVDTGTTYSVFGQTVIAGLIQIGGLGVMTYSSLVFYLLRRRVSLTDRIAVGQLLLSDPAFDLGYFLKRMVLVCLCIECIGAAALYVGSQGEIGWFSAFFHAVSAFCNAGFSMYPDNLMRFAQNWPVNLTIMALIILGGIGFYVLLEIPAYLHGRLRRQKNLSLSWHSTVVIRTSFWLIVIGWALIYWTEIQQNSADLLAPVLPSLFQSVTARTAGFNTMNIGAMTDTALFVLILLMVIGGSPASCAGGIKTTTLRVLLSFGVSQIKGRRQVVVAGYGVDFSTINKAMTLAIVAFILILGSLFVLTITEGANVTHQMARGKFIELFFEAASAFGTAGLSTGLTPYLSTPGKLVVMLLMFVGRLGPIVFLVMLQAWQIKEHFQRAEKTMLIG